jgi:hypothetical protein
MLVPLSNCFVLHVSVSRFPGFGLRAFAYSLSLSVSLSP